MTPKTIVIELPHDVLLCHDVFNDLVRDHCGSLVEEMFRIQKIRSGQSLIGITDVFEFRNHDCVGLNEIKAKIAFRLTSGAYQVKIGFTMDVDLFLQALICIKESTTTPGIDP